uniref:Fe2OG dioxygenase domain-containing protein n=1 Tax=Manihot esculenta TaxID=3983 RepID=A0A2C9WH57_MANES
MACHLHSNTSQIFSYLSEIYFSLSMAKGSSLCTTNDSFSGEEGAIPLLDYSKLVSSDPILRSLAIQDLGQACVRNHAIPGTVINGIIDKLFEFFDLPEDYKHKYDTKDPTDLIRWGKGNINHVSREFVKMAVHPTFHCPSNPHGFSEILQEYTQKVRELGIQLLGGISMALGLEKSYIEKKMNLESGYDFFTANDYPSRQHSENRIGQFAHIDPGLIILIIQNVSGGLQVKHNGKWLNVNLQPDWIFVNVADHLEILTNGKYKSAVHRVVVNNEVRRATLPLFLGPSLDTVVKPAPEFTDDSNPPAYVGITYKHYLEYNNFHVIDGKSCLNQIRI